MAAQPASPLQWPPPAPEVVTPLFYWRSLWRWRLWLIGLTLAGAALGSGAAWLRTPTYRARTVLRPISAPEVVSQFSFASSLLGMGGKSEADAYRYISIITSHQFLFRLIDEHGLTESRELAANGWLGTRPLDRWGAYRALKSAMEVQFDRRQGNIVTAPRRWPTEDLVDDIVILPALLPTRRSTARNSISSPTGVEVPWALM